MALSRKKLIYIALGIVLLGAIAYFVFTKSGTPSDSASALSVNPGPGSEDEQQFLGLASQLDSISFDTSILSNPRFIALQDIHTAILPETPGRTDPFAPLAGVAAAR